MAKKAKSFFNNRPTISIGVYIILIYWLVWAIIYFSIDLFIDLYTDLDYSTVFWYTAVAAIPFTFYTVSVVGKWAFSKWYHYVILPLLIYGFYVGSAYFSVLKIDLLFSALFKKEITTTLPIRDVQRVFARKSGNIHTNVSVLYKSSVLTLQGSRTSYFLLKDFREINVNIGQSYLGSYYATYISIPTKARWNARGEYFKDWFQRHFWLLAVLALLAAYGWLKQKYFPKPLKSAKAIQGPYVRFFRRIFFAAILLFAVFMVIVLLVGLSS